MKTNKHKKAAKSGKRWRLLKLSEDIMTNIKLDCNAEHDIKIGSSSVSGTAWVLIDDMSIEFSFNAKLLGDRWQDYDGSMVSEIVKVFDFDLVAGDAWLVDSDGDTIDEITYDLQAAHKAGVIEALETAVYEVEAA